MKVNELIEHLKQYPQDADVYIDNLESYYELDKKDIEYRKEEHQVII